MLALKLRVYVIYVRLDDAVFSQENKLIVTRNVLSMKSVEILSLSISLLLDQEFNS